MKTRNRLEKAQKSALLGWVAEGLETSEINKRAADFEPPFRVSPAQVDYYRKTRKVNLAALSASDEYDALNSGLALKEERVKRLGLLAGMLEEDIFGGVLWTQDVKMIGTGEYQERVEFELFNASEVQQYRGVLDDIAKETGGRATKTELTGKDGGEVILRVVYDRKDAPNA
jgi:hypothetical protein